MFNKEFYPTPYEVIQMMGFDCQNKVCLEPHGGKGDIIDYLNNNGAKNVLCCEINKDLAAISASKGQLIGNDFLKVTADQISHVQLIVMNPPFSNADKHINHAFDIAPDGCEIYALCNYQTVTNDRGWGRTKLTSTIENYGLAENIGAVFSNAERTTGIDIGLVKLFKPNTNSDTEFEGFFIEDDEEEEQHDGIMRFNEVRAVVNIYVNAVKSFDKINSLVDSLNSTTNYLGVRPIEFSFKERNNLSTKEEYVKKLQKQSWSYIIDKMNLRKFTTSQMAKDINSFVENQQKYPFTMRNIYHMMDMIIQTRGNQFNKALVIAVDKFTEHIDDNRFGVEGWKTNNGHMLNQKIIIPNVFERGWNNASYVDVRYNSHYKDKIDDLVKVVCLIEGIDYREVNGFNVRPDGTKTYEPSGIHQFKVNDSRHLETGVWHDWGMFEFKCFYKGTMHLKFKDKDVWARLNMAYAKAKGFELPEKIFK